MEVLNKAFSSNLLSLCSMITHICSMPPINKMAPGYTDKQHLFPVVKKFVNYLVNACIILINKMLNGESRGSKRLPFILDHQE